MRLVTKALVLNRFEVGESDLLVVLLSPKWGRFAVMAKGARRSKRRFVNALEPFTVFRAHIRGNRPGLIPFLDQIDPLEYWEPLRQDPYRFVLASYATELTEAFARPQVGGNLFPLLCGFFDLLCQGGPPDLLKPALEIKLLCLSGFAPELSRCVRCQRPRPLRGFSLEEGGGVCGYCLRESDTSISPQVLSLLKTLEKYPLSKLERICVPKDRLKIGSSLLENFLVRILGHDLKSLRIWKEIKGGEIGEQT